MNINWQKKLTSRKLWVAIAGFVAGLIILGNGSQETADKISGAILSGAAVPGKTARTTMTPHIFNLRSRRTG